MTVKELISAAPGCDSVEIVVREKGNSKWIQGYRAGKDIEVFPCEYTIELQEALNEHKRAKQIHGNEQSRLTKDEIRDVFHGHNLPMKLIKKSVEHLPDNVAQLQVCDFQPRHIPTFHREQLFHNEFLLEINAYPEGWMPEKEEKVTNDNQNIEGQMNIMDYLEEKHEDIH